MFSRASVQAGAAPHILKNVRDLNVACYQASPVSSVPSWPILARCTGRPDSEPRVAQKTAADPERSMTVSNNGRSSKANSDLFGEAPDAFVRVRVHQGASENAANSIISSLAM
jgi:hypothetical protein